MKRLLVQLLALTVIAGLAATVESCGGSNSGPTAPSGLPFTISGIITAYRGGPVSGVSVAAARATTQTDAQGHYTFQVQPLTDLFSPSPVAVTLDVWKQGYAPAWKTKVSSPDSTANFVLYPSLTLSTSGDTVAGTIWGDELHAADAGDDVLFGGLCVHTACKVVLLDDTHPLTSADIEVRLRWADPTRQLVLYTSIVEVADFDPPKLVEQKRFCCSFEFVTTFSDHCGPPECERYLAVAFEQSGGRPPGPSDSQPFELTVQPKQ